jgi:hypothetical protein
MQSGADAIAFAIFLSLLLTAGVVFVLPSILAFSRQHPNRWIILVINVALGGTLIGWGVAMVWAMRAVHRGHSGSAGGESGLNIFLNDVKKVQLMEPAPLLGTSTAQELERLHALLTQGAISQAEFDGLKERLLDNRQ